MLKSEKIYCTYFDKGFLLKGLALHASLLRYNPNAKLWILAFDKYTEKILERMKLKSVTVVALEDFEDKELLAVKPTRHPIEYYWTCTPSWILYVLKKSQAEYAIYLDADLYFCSDPDKSVSEIDDKSLLAVEHRLPAGREGMAKVSGRFNVAFNVFKNDKIGKACLKRWRVQCLDWCYWKPEGGKLGDQKYLDEWPKLYGKDLAVSRNVGVDVAPWNISQYKVTNKDSSTYINEDRLVCYHFHQFQILGQNHFSRVLGYTLSKEVVKYIYEPYEEELRYQYGKVIKLDKNYIIKETEKDKGMILRQKLAKYLGPAYWRMKSLLKWPRN
jgi:lipopolysaccharide biosynthesis glycosyltransferase